MNRAAESEGTTLFIVNPAAGRGRARALLPRLREHLARRGAGHVVEVTGAPGDAEALAAGASGRLRGVVAVGGDGTLHEVVNGLRPPRRVPLGFLPTGSGNDYARMFRLARTLEGRLNRILSGDPVRVDLGLANGRVFVNGLGLGFEAEVTRRSAEVPHLRGLPLYLSGVLKALGSYQGPEVRLVVDGEERPRGRLLLLSVGNGRAVGGGFRLTPAARIEDGRLDLCRVRMLPSLGVLAFLVPTIVRLHTRLPPVTMDRCTALRLEADRPLPLHLDGELYDPVRAIDVRVLPGALEVLGDLR